MPFTPQDTVFVLLSFEGPDVYSQAGGLGVRAKELSRALAERGFDTHLFFVGDPQKPGQERWQGVTLHRWSQWVSRHHPGGVYDGEEDKVRDWNHSLPAHLIDAIIVPAAAAGRRVAILAEEWHTAWSMNLLSDALFYRGLRDRAVILWNANGLYGFDRVDWQALQTVATVTTVSRYMKHRMWEWGVNPIVIPNGIPAGALADPPAEEVRALRKAMAGCLSCFKIGRFNPDKRWLMAMTALGLMKRQDRAVKLLMRGGREPHGTDVLAHANMHGLRVDDVPAPLDVRALARVLHAHAAADVINIVTFLPEPLLAPIYSAADAVLANSGHEPFGLVGLEVMAAGGLAVTGSTGEDYAEPFRNAIVLETDDPLELGTALTMVHDRPELVASLRERGRATAREFAWEKVIDQLLYWLDLAAGRQGTAEPAGLAAGSRGKGGRGHRLPSTAPR